MSGASVTSTATAIRPFTIPAIPDVDLEDLRGRITATRWPDPELVGDFSQGVQEAVMQELGRRQIAGLVHVRAEADWASPCEYELADTGRVVWRILPGWWLVAPGGSLSP